MITEDIKNALLPIHGASIIKLTLSNPKSALEEYKKITARKADKLFLVEKFTEKQAFHEKLDEGDLIDFVEKALSESFRQLNIQAEGFDFELKISKKGKILTNKSKNDLSFSAENVGSHNRKKNYILEEGIFVPALYELGVMTKEGKIVAQ